MPTVSIVVPAYRAARTLSRTIRSVATQTFSDWELIIVDGQSGDGTDRIVRSWRERLGDRLVFIEQPNRGCSGGRNRGIDEARGEFIALLDADDEFLPTKLERQLELFRLRSELGLVYSDYAFVDLDGRYHPSVFAELAPIAFDVPREEVAPGLRVCTGDLFDFLVRQYFIATIVGLIRRNVLGTDIRFMPGDMYGGEWLFYLEVARRTHAGYVTEPLCLHHHVTGSLSRTSKHRNLVHLRKTLHEMRRRFADAPARSRRTIRQHIGRTCRQLGMAAYKRGSYAEAGRHFREALRYDPDARTMVHAAQSSMRRWISRARGPSLIPAPAAASSPVEATPLGMNGTEIAAAQTPAGNIPMYPAGLRCHAEIGESPSAPLDANPAESIDA